MRKLNSFLSGLAAILLIVACSNEELLPETKPETGRTLTLTATMPGDNPTTRVALNRDGKDINLTWEQDDELQFAFVQGATKRKSTTTVTNITNNGKRAQFTINIPDGIDEKQDFDLYGVYGGGGLLNTNPTDVILPANAGVRPSLTEVHTNKDVMIYFESKAVNAATVSDISVTFQHLGSLFAITLLHDGADAPIKPQEFRIQGVDGKDYQWAYNSNGGAQTYSLETGFGNVLGHYIYFKPTIDFIKGEPQTIWAWYPPVPGIVWPELKLLVQLSAGATWKTSQNSKPARTSSTPAGRTYHFYAKWDGANINFTNESFDVPTIEHTVDVSTMGTLNAMLLSTGQKDNISKLTVTGTINATDFEVMKSISKMPRLTYIDLSGVTCEKNEIPNYAFGGNKGVANENINTIVLPATITTIGEHAFRTCLGLTGTFNIPANVTTIGKMAFNACNNIAAFRFANSNPIAYTNSMLPPTAKIEVPINAVAAFKAADGWKDHEIIGY